MALEQFQLDGQVAIVTGAGRGVGEGIAVVDGGLQGPNSELSIPDL